MHDCGGKRRTQQVIVNELKLGAIKCSERCGVNSSSQTHTSKSNHTHTHTHAHTHAHTHTHTQTHTHRHTHTHACTHACAWTHTHTHTHSRAMFHPISVAESTLAMHGLRSCPSAPIAAAAHQTANGHQYDQHHTCPRCTTVVPHVVVTVIIICNVTQWAVIRGQKALAVYTQPHHQFWGHHDSLTTIVLTGRGN